MCIRVWFHAHSIKTLIISFFILWRGVTWLAGDIVYYFNKKLGYIYIYIYIIACVLPIAINTCWRK